MFVVLSDVRVCRDVSTISDFPEDTIKVKRVNQLFASNHR